MALTPHRREGDPGGQPPRPTPQGRQLRRGVAVNAVEATLGQVLLLLIGLVAVLFVLIVLLVEAHYIMRLSRRLVRRLRSGDNREPIDPGSPTAHGDPTQRPPDHQEVR